MRFDLFEKMDKTEAEILLQKFLEDGEQNIEKVFKHAREAGVHCDYNVGSLPSFLEWGCSQVKTVPKEPDMSVPEWIRSTADYQKNLFDFDESSRELIVVSAYYFGECFVRNYSQLIWSTGNPDYATGRMPVVSGFSKG